MKNATRLLSLFLVLALCIQMLPVNALAEEYSDEGIDNIEEANDGRPGTMVLGELTDRRTENEKHFRMDDGSYIAVDYGMPVHFTEDDGTTWEDIDNTLTLSEGTAGSRGQSVRGSSLDSIYTTNNGDSARNFAYNLRTGFLFSTQTGTHNLRMSLTDAAAENDQANFRKNGTINDAEKVTASEKTSDNDSADDANTYFNPSSFAEISYPDSKEANRGSNKSNYRLTTGESSGSDLSISEQVMPAKLRTDILYRDVYDNVDLHYELCSYNIKETILINQPRDSYSFTFYFDSGDLTPVLMEDGSCVLQDEESEVVYLIPAPYMTDNEGEFSDAVTYSLDESASGSWALTITADEDWMNDESRAYPVSIDPTLYDAVHPSDILKRCVADGGDPEDYIYHQNLVCGNHPTYGQTEVYFKISQLPTIPAGSEAVSAIVSFYQNDYRPQSGNNSVVLSVKPCLTGISNYNTLTWNSRPALGPVLDYNISSYSTIGNWLSWDVTSEAKKWYANASTNYGLAMTSDATSSNHRRAWFTYSTVFFYVTYRDMTGIEPYYSYQTLGADHAGTAYISDYTGSLTMVTPLVSYASTVNPFSLNLVYNSSYFKGEGPDNVTVPINLGYGMRMGSGMKLDLLQKVEYVDLQYELESSGTRRYVKYTDGDGTAHYFATDSEKQANEPAGSTTYYYDEDGLGLKITEYVDNYFRMEDDNGNKWYFVYGFLTIIQDANGNSINLWFKRSDGTMASNGYPYGTGNTLDHITLKNNGKAAITVATFAYNTDDGANTLHSVTDAAGNVYSFQYSCHKLRFIKQNGHSYVDFVHPYNNTTNRYVNPVVEVKDNINNYSLHFTYSDSKISSYYEKGGNSQGAGANITYVPGERTKYIDWGNDRTYNTQDDISTTYLFDYAGRTVNAFSTDVNGAILGASNSVHSGTGNTDKKNNRTLRSAGIGLAGVSMVRNGSFELSGSGMDWTIVKPEGSTCAATIKTGELTRTGTKAFKTWVNASATGPTGGKKLIGILTAGQTYTASVYVNTSAATSFGNKGVYLRILDSYGSYKTGEYLNYKTDTAIDGGWVKLTFTFTPERSVNHYICVYDEGVKGAVYYDDLQVEAGSSPSNVNLLDNGGISSSAAGWLTEGNAAATAANVTAIQGNKAIQINGDPTTEKYVYQTVALNQPGTQTYVLSGWAKANAVPDNQNPVKEANETEDHYRERVAMDTNKQYGLRAILTYDDTNHTQEYHYVSFNADITDWQFTSLAIVPKQATKTVASIQVVCAYEKNANTAYFDNISLVKEIAQTMKYDKDGNLVSVQSTGKKEETSSYNNGNLSKFNSGDYGTFEYKYDSKHNVTEAYNNRMSEKIDYDTTGNATKTTITPQSSTSSKIVNKTDYSADGNRIEKMYDTRGKTTSYLYSTDAEKMNASAHKTTDAKGTVTVTNYDSETGLAYSSWINGQVSLAQQYSYGLLSSITREGYNYNLSNPQPEAQTYNLTYDSFGNMTKMSVGTQWLVQNTYGAKNGALTRQLMANGAYIDYSYDDLGRMIQKQTSAGDSYNYQYTGDGQLGFMSDERDQTNYQYAYDTMGRLIRTTRSGAQTFQGQYTYDTVNRITKINYNIPDVVDNEYAGYYYNDDANNTDIPVGSIRTMSMFSKAWLTYTYDPFGRQSARGIAGILTEENSFLNGANTGETTSIISGKKITNSTGTTLNNFTYAFDALGNITTAQDTVAGERTDYTYDVQGQLLTAKNYHGPTLTKSYTYTYDTYGNIRSASDGNTTHSYSYEDGNWLDKLTAFDGHTIQYDNSGNPLLYYNGTNYAFSWENGKELASLTKGSATTSYRYDVDGLRTKKTNPDGSYSDYYWMGTMLLAEQRYNANGTKSYTFVFNYDENDTPIGISIKSPGASSFTNYYYAKNVEGDVIGLYQWIWSSTGAHTASKVATYEYDPWGKLLSVKDANGTEITSASNAALLNPIRYRGYYYDTESSFYYLQARYYDPAICRFLNADDYSDTDDGYLGYNMFAYCLNNPVNRSDSIGNFSLPNWAKIAIGVAVIAVAAAVTVATAGAAGPVVAAVHCAAAGAFHGAVAGAVKGAVSGAVTGAIEHRIKTGSWKGAGRAALDGACDGFMTGSISGAIEGAITSPYCFVAGTLVQTENGPVAIEEIQVGDSVWAWDEVTGTVALKSVVDTYINETYELIHIFVNDEEIVATPAHPFYSPLKGWTKACNLSSGDVLVLSTGEYVVIDKVQYEQLQNPQKVYNLNICDFHTYYVGCGILVHNSCGGRHGGEAHRNKVNQVKESLSNKGWSVSKAESRVYFNGAKYRYPDIIAKKNGITRFYQIGRVTSSGKPVAREIRALRDLGKVARTYFVPYN